MEHQNVLYLLDESKDSQFATRKLDIVNDQSKANYDAGSEIS